MKKKVSITSWPTSWKIVEKKKNSQSNKWKVYIVSVHEDRCDSDNRLRESGARVYSEVAGLEDNQNTTLLTTSSSGGVASGGGGRPNRRLRPRSLAVQPLNYHRLDSEQQQQQQRNPPTAPVKSNRPKMTSQDSIGSCSLNVDRSASERSGSVNMN